MSGCKFIGKGYPAMNIVPPWSVMMPQYILREVIQSEYLK